MGAAQGVPGDAGRREGATPPPEETPEQAEPLLSGGSS